MNVKNAGKSSNTTRVQLHGWVPLGEKSFKCKGCGKAVRSSYDCIIHEKNHLPPRGTLQVQAVWERPEFQQRALTEHRAPDDTHRERSPTWGSGKAFWRGVAFLQHQRVHTIWSCMNARYVSDGTGVFSSIGNCTWWRCSPLRVIPRVSLQT